MFSPSGKRATLKDLKEFIETIYDDHCYSEVVLIHDQYDGNMRYLEMFGCTQDVVTMMFSKNIKSKEREYNDYVAYIIADNISKTMCDKYDWTNDEVWLHCVELAKDFEQSKFNNYDRPQYECVYDFINELKRKGELYE